MSGETNSHGMLTLLADQLSSEISDTHSHHDEKGQSMVSLVQPSSEQFTAQNSISPHAWQSSLSSVPIPSIQQQSSSASIPKSSSSENVALSDRSPATHCASTLAPPVFPTKVPRLLSPASLPSELSSQSQSPLLAALLLGKSEKSALAFSPSKEECSENSIPLPSTMSPVDEFEPYHSVEDLKSIEMLSNGKRRRSTRLKRTKSGKAFFSSFLFANRSRFYLPK